MQAITPVKRKLPSATDFLTPTNTRREREAPCAPKKTKTTKGKSQKKGSVQAGCQPFKGDYDRYDGNNGAGSLPISIS